MFWMCSLPQELFSKELNCYRQVCLFGQNEGGDSVESVDVWKRLFACLFGDLQQRGYLMASEVLSNKSWWSGSKVGVSACFRVSL